MRQEAKEVDGFELQEAQERRRASDLVEDDEDQLYGLAGEPAFARPPDRASLVAAAMHRIFQREHIALDELGLEWREQRALEALMTAVEGRDRDIHAFVFAEDRRALLEQALAVLQPDLARLEQLAGDSFHVLVQEVADLRRHLGTLEDAQEEIEHRGAVHRESEAGDTDDPPEADDASAADGERDTAPSSLTGPERTPEPKPQSSLTGPERTPEPKPPCSLIGPEREQPAKAPTTLGDPDEIAAATRPRWRPE